MAKYIGIYLYRENESKTSLYFVKKNGNVLHQVRNFSGKSCEYYCRRFIENCFEISSLAKLFVTGDPYFSRRKKTTDLTLIIEFQVEVITLFDSVGFEKAIFFIIFQ